MNLIEYLNQIYDTDDLHDYKYRKIQPDAADLVETDLKKLVLILDIVRLKENYEQTDNVFEQINSKILPDIKTITSEDLEPIISLDIISFPLAIRARIADFLWTTIKDYKFAKIAIQSYLQLYESLWDDNNWHNCVEMIHRAINIAAGYNKNGNEYRECIAATQRGLERTKGNDKLYLSSSLIGILAKQNCKLNDNIKKYARNGIEMAKSAGDFSKAQDILESLAKMDPSNKAQYYEEAGDIIRDCIIDSAIRRVDALNQAFKKKENHRRAAIYAMTHGQSLNSFIEEAVEDRLNAIHA